jgi:hypothetical protein
MNKILKVMAIVIIFPLFATCSFMIVAPFVGMGAAVVLPAVQEYDKQVEEAKKEEEKDEVVL